MKNKMTIQQYLKKPDAASYYAIHDQITLAMDALCEKDGLNWWSRSKTTVALAAITGGAR